MDQLARSATSRQREPTMQRNGNILLVTLIALAVASLMVVAAIQFTGVNRRGAASQLRGDQISSCAEAARRYLISKLDALHMPVTELKVNERLPDNEDLEHQTYMMTAHYGGDAGTNTISVVSSSAIGQARSQVREMSNVAPSSTTLGGQYYRVVMKCQESSEEGGRESELEFVFRYGM
jgi:type II secretory pathway component PulK